jgi:hypothetical protein
MAIARIRWLGGGQQPDPGSTMGATAVFVLGDDAEVIPGWPATGQHVSVLLGFLDTEEDARDVEAKVEFLDRDAVADNLREGATFLVMAGPKPIAEAQITAIPLEPDP